MGDDITITTALFQMVQRIEDKLDNVKDDLSSVKSKQAVIEISLQDHIDNSVNSEKPSGMDKAKSYLLRYALPISLALILIGRWSVPYVGNSNKISVPVNQTSGKVIQDDTFIARNERVDSLIRATIKKQAGLQ